MLHKLDDKGKSDYANLILRIAKNKPQPALSFAIKFAEKPIIERVKSIMRYKKSSVITSVISGLLVCAVIMVFATGTVNSTGIQGNHEKTTSSFTLNDPMPGESSQDESNPVATDGSSAPTSAVDSSSVEYLTSTSAVDSSYVESLTTASAVDTLSVQSSMPVSTNNEASPVMPERIEIIDKDRLTLEQGYVEQDYVSIGFACLTFHK